MTTYEQIAEMAKDICEYYYEGVCYQDKKSCDCKCDIFTDAQYLYAKGYRKIYDDHQRQCTELKKKELQTELHQVENKLYDFDYEEKKARYGNKFTCEFCKYNAYQDFSSDGWHNTCGADNCTCCHSVCRKYEPDNDVTLFIKQHIRADSGLLRSNHTNGFGHIDDEEYRGIKYLIGDIFKPYDQSEKMIELLKVCFDTKVKESEDTE